jgi:predicted DCC family thiol-disulfide oxidoreductase YuxK
MAAVFVGHWNSGRIQKEFLFDRNCLLCYKYQLYIFAKADEHRIL